eukprot:383659_1
MDQLIFGTNVALDNWAVGKHTPLATVLIQSTCLLISIIFIFLRVYHIYHHLHAITSDHKLLLVISTQLLMMIVSVIYTSLHLWNYLFFYLFLDDSFNATACQRLFSFILGTLVITRILLFTFLMLRSSLAFQNSFYNLSPKISIIAITTNFIGNLLTFIFVILHTEPFKIFPFNNFCFRKLDKVGHAANATIHLFSNVASIAALIIFYLKTRSVRKEVKLLGHNKMSAAMQELNIEFKKHTSLGMITVSGTIITYFAFEMFTVLLGICFNLDQLVNNILTTLILDKYLYLRCCSCKRVKDRKVKSIMDVKVDSIDTKRSHGVEMETIQSKETTNETTGTVKSSIESTTDGTISKLPKLQKSVTTYDKTNTLDLYI